MEKTAISTAKTSTETNMDMNISIDDNTKHTNAPSDLTSTKLNDDDDDDDDDDDGGGGGVEEGPKYPASTTNEQQQQQQQQQQPAASAAAANPVEGSGQTDAEEPPQTGANQPSFKRLPPRNGVWQGDEDGYYHPSFVEDPWRHHLSGTKIH